jgi:dolichyl-phosphate beta-glucosyltransferase
MSERFKYLTFKLLLMISFVIPAYNEENRIGKSLIKLTNYLNRFFKKYEIICVVDGTDKTDQIVDNFKIKNPRIKLLEYKKRLGKGGALQKGVMKSKGEKIILIDADLPVPLKSIKDVNELLDKYDVVNVEKIYSGFPFYRRIMRVFWIIIQKLLFPGTRISETQGGFKGFKNKIGKRLFRNLKISGFSAELEILVKASKMGFSIKNYPAKFSYSKDSKVNPFFDWFLMLIEAFKIRRNLNEARL